MKAILVDDEPDGIKTLQKMLERYCPAVTVAATCNNAMAAKQQIEALKPDVVFLDIQMPGKSGIEMIGELPAKNPDLNIAERLKTERRRKVLGAEAALILLMSAVALLAVWLITGNE